MKEKYILSNKVYIKKTYKSLCMFNYDNPNDIIVLDKRILKILKLCNGSNDINFISKKLKIKKEILIKLIDILKEYNILIGKENNVIKKEKVLHCWLHVTNKCNLNCKYCYINKNNNEMSYDIAVSSIDKIIKKYQEEQYNEILITFAGGEPFLNYDLMKKVINYNNKNNNINFRYRILTNGTLLNEEYINFIKKNNIDIRISLDGIEKYNDINRYYKNGLGTYNKVISNIILLKENNINPTINVVITKNNMKGLESVTKKLLLLDVPFRYSLEKTNEDKLPELVNVQKELIKNLKKGFKKILNTQKQRNVYFQFEDIKFNNNTCKNCEAGKNTLAISEKGNVAICGMGLNKATTNINSSEIREILNKMQLKQQNNECKNCKWRKVCNNGCPLFNYSNKLIKNPYCMTYKKIIPLLFKINVYNKILNKQKASNK